MYFVGVVGAQEIYNDPRERIAAQRRAANNNNKGPEGASSHSLGPGSAPVSVVVDVVTHDEPSVCSAMSNGGLTQHDNSVSLSHLGILQVTVMHISEET